jgi:hypothetical protein
MGMGKDAAWCERSILRRAHKLDTALGEQFSRGRAYVDSKESPPMKSDCKFRRELKGIAGRVYQMHAGDSMVAIDWKPLEPILGRAVLTRGKAEFHPTEGKVVYFPGGKQGLGRIRIAVRTSERPDLLELFDLAVAMTSDLTGEIKSAQAEMRRA